MPRKRRKNTDDLLPRILFTFSLLFFAFVAGVAFQRFQFPPYQLLHTVYMQLRYSPEHVLNDMGIKPTRHLVENRQPETAPKDGEQADASTPVALAPLSGQQVRFDGADLGVVRTLNAGAMAPGNRLIFGLTPRAGTLFGAMLLAPDGELLHFWPIDYAAIDPDGPSPNNVYVHGSEVFPNGDIVNGFDSGRAFARLDACGAVRWRKAGQHHHAMALREDGVLATFLFLPPRTRRIVFYDAETGEAARNPIDIKDDLFTGPDHQGVLGIRDTEANQRHKEPFHFNDIEFLGNDMAAAFPHFAAGDMMLSLRELNLVIVLDPDTLAMKWWQHGPWHRQHDPDFMPDGRISVFDNSRFKPPSRILAIDPLSRQIETSYSGSVDQPFYSGIRGKHQVLENGNLLITESNAGRAFEVTAGGEIVWEFISRYDAYNNAVISKAMLLPRDFFDQGALACPSS